MRNEIYFCCVLVAIFMDDNVIKNVVSQVLQSGKLKHSIVKYSLLLEQSWKEGEIDAVH